MILIVVLVVLMLTLLAGMGVMQSVQTGNALAGNYSFRQVATQASDRAVSDALAQVANRVIGGAGNTAVANLYYPTAAAPPNLNAMGIPTAINWGLVGCTDEKGAVLGDCAADTGNYRVQYVIERRCSSNPTLTGAPALTILNSIRSVCEFEPSATAGSPATIALRYRVLIRVRGPRGTESFFEAVLSGPATT
jgi:Tfp pilus assembly protein PilX